MKIGIVSPNYLPSVGGTEIALFNISKRYAELGNRVVIVSKLRGRGVTHESFDGVEVHRFRTFKSALSYPHAWMLLHNQLNTALKDVDIIHQFHLFRFGWPVYQFSKKHNKPLITSLMGADTFDPIKKVPKIIFPYLAFVMNNSRYVTSPSRIIADYAYNQGCNKEIQLIPLGTDVGRFKQANIGEDAVRSFKKRFGLKDDTILLLALQRLSLRKRIDILIHAARELRDVHNVKNFKILIAGKGEEKEKLERLVHRYNLQDQVQFLGFIPPEWLPVCYKAADMFVFHSTFEAFGLVLAEAMAAGKPIVSTKVGSIPEVVKDGETGLLVGQNDPKAFAEAINKLIHNPGRLKSMGEKGKARAEALYDWNVICRKYMDLYQRALDGG